MKTFRISLFWLLAAVLLTGVAMADSIDPTPDCGRPEIEDGALFIVNPCNMMVSVVYTSYGEVWGETLIGPGEHHRTAYSSKAVDRVGGVYVYTCPGYGTPVRPDGVAIINDYMDRQYGCHGLGVKQSADQGQNRALQPGTTSQEQVQQTLSNPAPTPGITIVFAPAASPAPVQEIQQTDDDDDDSATADQNENGIDLQQYQQALQSINNMRVNNSVQRVAPPPRVAPPVSCVYCWK